MGIELTQEAEFIVKSAVDAYKRHFKQVLRERLLAAIEPELVSIIEEVADQIATAVHAYKQPMGFQEVLVFEQVIHDRTAQAGPNSAPRVRNITPQK